MTIKNPPKILLVEDLKIAQKIATIRLQELGCEVLIAATGAAAVELAKNNSFDLIFMDLGLQDMEGLAVVTLMRELDTGAHIPIVVLTAHDDEAIRERCFKAGVNDFVVKPLTRENGDKILEKFL